jgi:hypothetical protein
LDAKCFFGIVEKWLYSWTDSVESKDEFVLSKALLESFLESKNVFAAMGSEMCNSLQEFVQTRILLID